MKLLIAAAALAFTTAANAAELAVHLEESAANIFHQTVLTDEQAPAELCNGYEGGFGFVQYMGNERGWMPKAIGCWYKNRADDIILLGRLLVNDQAYTDDIAMEDFRPIAPNFQLVARGVR